MTTKTDPKTELEQLEQFVSSRSPRPDKRNYGLSAREQRRKEAIKQKITICLDQDIIQQFKELAVGERGYQSLINQALREWLLTNDIKELVSEEFQLLSNKLCSQLTQQIEEKMKKASSS